MPDCYRDHEANDTVLGQSLPVSSGQHLVEVRRSVVTNNGP